MENKDMPVEHEHQPKTPEGFRGKVAKKLGATVLASSMMTGMGAPPVAAVEDDSTHHQASIEQIDNSKRSESAAILRAEFDEISGESLSFEEASALVPKIADFYVDNINTDLSAEEITENSYLVSGRINDKDMEFVKENILQITALRGIGVDFSDSPLYRRMKADYPELELDDQIHSSTLASIYLTQVGEKALLEISPYGQIFKNQKSREEDFYGLVVNSDKKAFVFLNAVNNSDNPQVESLDSRVCSESSPPEALATALVHETVHRDAIVHSSEVLENSLSPVLDRKFRSIVEKDKEIDGVYVLGFGVLATKSDGVFGTEQFSGLEEFVTHFITVKMLTENGIPALLTSDRAPQAISNFESILDQAGLNLQDVKELHSNSRLEDFLIKIAEGADGVELGVRDEKLEFGFELFSDLFQYKKGWQNKFDEHFDIDLHDYGDVKFTDDLIYKGCNISVLDNTDVATK